MTLTAATDSRRSRVGAVPVARSVILTAVRRQPGRATRQQTNEVGVSGATSAMRIAVIGAGAMGKQHARVYRDLDGARLVAIADSDPETARRVGERHGVAAYVDHREL